MNGPNQRMYRNLPYLSVVKTGIRFVDIGPKAYNNTSTRNVRRKWVHLKYGVRVLLAIVTIVGSLMIST